MIRLLHYLDGYIGLLTLDRVIIALTAGIGFAVLAIFGLGVIAGWLLL